MNPHADLRYRLHQTQAARRGLPPLDYANFCRRLPETYETDLTGLLSRPLGLTVPGKKKPKAKFRLGHLYITPGAAKAVPHDEAWQAVERHAASDWGQLDAPAREANEKAVHQRGQIVSVYETSKGQKFYVVTAAGWEFTTLVLPTECREN
jgi:hypothetical protein